MAWMRADVVDPENSRLVLVLSLPKAWHTKLLHLARQIYDECMTSEHPAIDPEKLTAQLEHCKRAWLKSDIEEDEYRAEQQQVQDLLATTPKLAFGALDAEQALKALSTTGSTGSSDRTAVPGAAQTTDSSRLAGAAHGACGLTRGCRHAIGVSDPSAG
jgi:hypothetical protein